MVDFSLTEDQTMMRDMAREFARDEIRPLAERYYQHGKDVPREELEKLSAKANALRLLDFYMPEEYGGLGITDHVLHVMIAEELAWGDAGVAVDLMASGLCAAGIYHMATDEQKKKYISRFCNPENREIAPRRACFCLTEPNAGSAVSQMSTTATPRDGGWVLNGTKQFITNGGLSELYLVVAQTNPAANAPMEKALGLAGFLVEAGTKGLSVGKEYEKWGVRASNTTEVVLQDVWIPKENKLGSDDPGGMMKVYSTLETTRIGVGACAVGIARAAFEAALKFSKERVQKKPIIEFQAISHKLADMEVKIQAARLLVLKAAWMAGANAAMNRGEGSQAKLYAGDIAVEVCTEAVQIHGGYGFVKEYPVGRWLNDAVIFKIWEGTAEIQRNTIARYLRDLS
ncbi:MAG: acyl-CoA dehydrogenase family protein [Acidobacteriota bacterium]